MHGLINWNILYRLYFLYMLPSNNLLLSCAWKRQQAGPTCGCLLTCSNFLTHQRFWFNPYVPPWRYLSQLSTFWTLMGAQPSQQASALYFAPSSSTYIYLPSLLKILCAPFICTFHSWWLFLYIPFSLSSSPFHSRILFWQLPFIPPSPLFPPLPPSSQLCVHSATLVDSFTHTLT
jgi:hypothetical protein